MGTALTPPQVRDWTVSESVNADANVNANAKANRCRLQCFGLRVGCRGRSGATWEARSSVNESGSAPVPLGANSRVGSENGSASVQLAELFAESENENEYQAVSA